jgi:hypothetical protein
MCRQLPVRAQSDAVGVPAGLGALFVQDLEDALRQMPPYGSLDALADVVHGHRSYAIG